MLKPANVKLNDAIDDFGGDIATTDYMRKNLNSLMSRIFFLNRIGGLFFFLLSLCSAPSEAASVMDYPFQDFVISVCKIDLRRDQLQMFWKDEKKVVLGRFDALQTWLRLRGQSLVCAMNAGIYGEDYRPIGLYVENSVVLRKLNVRKNAYGNFYMQPNGVFVIRDHQAEIIDTDRFAAERETLLPDVRFATQSGPLMIKNGSINDVFSSSSSNRLIRNAVCTTSPYQSVLALSRGPINLYEFSQFLRNTLGCTDALYLDGNISRMYPGEGLDLGPSFGVIIGVTK